MQEDKEFEDRVKEIEQWFKSPRFENTTRPYDAATVAAKRGSLPVQYASNIQAKKLWSLMQRYADQKKPLLTMGAIDPVQMTQMAANQEVLYVSGWATSSVLASNNEVGPDFGGDNRAPRKPLITQIMPTHQCLTKSNGSSRHSNSMTRNIMISGGN